MKSIGLNRKVFLQISLIQVEPNRPGVQFISNTRNRRVCSMHHNETMKGIWNVGHPVRQLTWFLQKVKVRGQKVGRLFGDCSSNVLVHLNFSY